MLRLRGGMLGGQAGMGPAWTRGEMEAPAGEKTAGTSVQAVYTAEQQARLGVSETGEATAAPAAAAAAWPQMVGQDGATAVAAIKVARPELANVVVVAEDAMVTMDWREDRVRVFVRADGTVARPPTVG